MAAGLARLKPLGIAALRFDGSPVAMMNTLFPTTRSARVAGAGVTMGTPSGTVTSLLPPLNDKFKIRPSTPVATVSTFALVIMLPGARFHS